MTGALALAAGVVVALATAVLIGFLRRLADPASLIRLRLSQRRLRRRRPAYIQVVVDEAAPEAALDTAGVHHEEIRQAG